MEQERAQLQAAAQDLARYQQEQAQHLEEGRQIANQLRAHVSDLEGQLHMEREELGKFKERLRMEQQQAKGAAEEAQVR